MHLLEELKSFDDLRSQLAAAWPGRERSQGGWFKFQVFSGVLCDCGKTLLSLLFGSAEEIASGERKF